MRLKLRTRLFSRSAMERERVGGGLVIELRRRTGACTACAQVVAQAFANGLLGEPYVDEAMAAVKKIDAGGGRRFRYAALIERHVLAQAGRRRRDYEGSPSHRDS
jgi:hypothetical protein